MLNPTAGSQRRGPDQKFSRPSIWLSMSGGGFRAAIFHYGCLKRLNELGLLSHVYAVSATSGGAVIGALLHTFSGPGELDPYNGIALADFQWESFEERFLALVREGVIQPIALLV